MKKRQIWLLGIVVGQAVAIVSKDKKLRDSIQETPGIFWKLKLIGEKRLHTNKTLIDEVSTIDRDKAWSNLESDVNHDIEQAKWRIDEQKNKDREVEGRETVRTIQKNIPSEEEIKKKVDTYSQKIKNWWDAL